jgi:hypothetical protein
LVAISYLEIRKEGSVADFAKRYRNLSDYGLTKLAADEDSLVLEAREALRAEIARRPTLLTLTPSPVEVQSAATDSLDGVGGWLAWYCLGLIGALYREIRIAISLHAGNGAVLAFAIFCLLIAAWNLATAISIIRRTRAALEMIFIQLTVGAIQGAIFVVVGMALLTSSPRSARQAVASITVGLLIGAGYAIWFWYFRVSKRVQTTFGRNL